MNRAYLAFAAEFPEELLVFKLAPLIRDHPRHPECDVINCVSFIRLNLQREKRCLETPQSRTYFLPSFSSYDEVCCNGLVLYLCSSKNWISPEFRLSSGVTEHQRNKFGSSLQLLLLTLTRVILDCWQQTLARSTLSVAWAAWLTVTSWLLGVRLMTVQPKYSPHSQFSSLSTVCAQALNTPQLLRAPFLRSDLRGMLFR